MARQPSTKAVQSALMPDVSDHFVKSAIRLVRQSTTVPNTSNTSAFTAEISDMVASLFLLLFALPSSSSFRDARLAQARNPYSQIVVMDSGLVRFAHAPE